jgi:hypothetical protein
MLLILLGSTCFSLVGAWWGLSNQQHTKPLPNEYVNAEENSYYGEQWSASTAALIESVHLHSDAKVLSTKPLVLEWENFLPETVLEREQPISFNFCHPRPTSQSSHSQSVS